MEKTLKKPGVIKIVLSGALAALCGQLPPLLFIAGGLMGNVLLSGGAAPFLFAAAIALLGSFLLYGMGGALVAAMVATSALLLFYMLHRKAAYFDTALVIAAFYTVALYLMIGYQDIRAGAKAFQSVSEMFSQYLSDFIASAGSTPGVAADQLKLLQETVPAILAQLPIYMPAILCGLGAALGLVNVLFCAKFGRDAGVQLKPMHRFLFWRLPPDFAWGVCAMGVGLLIAAALKVSAMDAILAAAVVVALIPFAVQGLSLVWFIGFVRRSGAVSMITLLLVAVFVLPAGLEMVVMLLAGLGVAEQLFHIRRRIVTRGDRRDGD